MKDLSLFFYRHHTHGNAFEIRPSPIPYFDLTVVLGGEMTYTVNGKTVTLKEGDAVLIKSGAVRARAASECRPNYVSFNFHTTTPPSLPEFIHGAVHSDVTLMIAACDEIIAHNPTKYESTLSHLLAAILSAMEDRYEHRNISKLTAEILEYLNQNIANKITLADVGALTFFSPVYCDTVFRRDTGLSIIDYLLGQRVAEAKKLLIEGVLSLGEIARKTGFEDSNYFSRVFKKRTGYTPTQYKKMQRTK